MASGNVFRIEISKKADKYFRKMSPDKKKKVNAALQQISKNPFNGANIKQLSPKTGNRYRYRIGDDRIIYSIYKDRIVVNVEKIGPRGDVYK